MQQSASLKLCYILRIRNFVELRPFAKYKEDCKEKNNENRTKAFRDSTDTRVPADRQVQYTMCRNYLFIVELEKSVHKNWMGRLPFFVSTDIQLIFS